MQECPVAIMNSASINEMYHQKPIYLSGRNN